MHTTPPSPRLLPLRSSIFFDDLRRFIPSFHPPYLPPPSLQGNTVVVIAGAHFDALIRQDAASRLLIRCRFGAHEPVAGTIDTTESVIKCFSSNSESYNRQTTGYEFVSVAINGQNFLPSDGILCKLSDNLTNVEMVFPGHYDTSEQIRCIAPRQDPHPGDGSLPGGRQYTTQRPCFFKDLQVSNDGGVSYSAVSEHARVFYCDVYVSVSGSDFTGEGTPDKPYQSIQRGIDMALDHPRSHYVYKNEGLTGTEMRGASRRGFAHYINRDRVILMTADYTGFGNIGASTTARAHSRCARAMWCVRGSLRAECAPVC